MSGMVARYAQKALKAMRANPDDRRHGTNTGYRYGCRCERCREAGHAYRSAKYFELKRHLEPEPRTITEPEPSPEPVPPSPLKAELKEKAAASRAKRKTDCCTVDALRLPMMGRPSIKMDRCAVCGRNRPLEQHHIVFRSAGKLVVNGREVPKPTITLCGFGNSLGDADGRLYCHGLAHQGMLHFRWSGELDGSGRWLYLRTDGPTRYQDALAMDGWREVRGGR